MNIYEACEDIIGKKLAYSIMTNPKLGLHWCVIAAMSDPRNAARPHACAVIRAFLAKQKAAVATDRAARHEQR